MLMVGAFKRGISMSAFENMTVGMLFDYVITYNNMEYGNEEDAREATQEDMDSF